MLEDDVLLCFFFRVIKCTFYAVFISSSVGIKSSSNLLCEGLPVYDMSYSTLILNIGSYYKITDYKLLLNTSELCCELKFIMSFHPFKISRLSDHIMIMNNLEVCSKRQRCCLWKSVHKEFSNRQQILFSLLILASVNRTSSISE